MNKGTLSNGKPRNYEYPENSQGTRIAEATRAQSAALTDNQREELFKKGMQVIYGATGNGKTVGCR